MCSVCSYQQSPLGWGWGVKWVKREYRDIWLYFTQGGPPSQSRFTIPLSFRTRQTYSTIQSAQRIGKKYNNEKQTELQSTTTSQWYSNMWWCLMHINIPSLCSWANDMELLVWNTTSMGCLTNQNLGKLPLHFNMQPPGAEASVRPCFAFTSSNWGSKSVSVTFLFVWCWNP